MLLCGIFNISVSVHIALFRCPAAAMAGIGVEPLDRCGGHGTT
jgi:hypothetical protein